MGFRRKFHGHPVVRLIVSVPVEVVEEVDDAIGYGKPWGRNHPARRNRSEFVRLAIVEKLEREESLRARTCPKNCADCPNAGFTEQYARARARTGQIDRNGQYDK